MVTWGVVLFKLQYVEYSLLSVIYLSYSLQLLLIRVLFVSFLTFRFQCQISFIGRPGESDHALTALSVLCMQRHETYRYNYTQNHTHCLWPNIKQQVTGNRSCDSC